MTILPEASMGSLVVEAWDGLGRMTGLAADTTPYVPSAPVQIGTSGPRHGVAEGGAWQALLVMFAVAIVVGTVVLLYVVRQRTRVLERRRARRRAATVTLAGDAAGSAAAGVAGDPADPADLSILHASDDGDRVPIATRAAPERPAPTA